MDKNSLQIESSASSKNMIKAIWMNAATKNAIFIMLFAFSIGCTNALSKQQKESINTYVKDSYSETQRLTQYGENAGKLLNVGLDGGTISDSESALIIRNLNGQIDKCEKLAQIQIDTTIEEFALYKHDLVKYLEFQHESVDVYKQLFVVANDRKLSRNDKEMQIWNLIKKLQNKEDMQKVNLENHVDVIYKMLNK